MKKKLLLICSLVLIVGLVACTNSKQENSDNNTNTIENNEATGNELVESIELEKDQVYEKDEIHKAANVGDINKVKEILNTNPDVDARDSFGGTALHAAMFQDNIEIVKLLLENGYDVNAIGPSNGYTPLHDAVWANNLEATKILVQNGANLNIKGNDGFTPLEKSLNENKPEIYNYLKSISE